ncbi:MAG: hypothetical protein IKQ37_04020 [Bacteroidaceae bacterium]|nr:hypothetical protein [Bacteroidaceae bacterium]
MKRIKTPQSQGRDYEKMLKEYFSFHLHGMEVKEEGGRVQVQIVYNDYKHIDTVRRELAQMMPEVEFTKLRREFTESAVMWTLNRMYWDLRGEFTPVIYVQHGDTLTKTTLSDIAYADLNQLELDDDDSIPYTADERKMSDADDLRRNAWE